jgi:hypothetical protein
MGDEDAKAMSLLELLRGVPKDARLITDHGPFETSVQPVGRYCHEAAAEIERLGNLCYDYIGKLTALRAAKQMQQRIDELKGLVRDWVPVAKRLPEPGQYVLAVFRYSTGKQVVIRAMHAPPKTLSEEDYGEFVTEGAEYDEATDTTYWPEGWYECNENEETHWQVHEEVTHWMPLPEVPHA